MNHLNYFHDHSFSGEGRGGSSSGEGRGGSSSGEDRGGSSSGEDRGGSSSENLKFLTIDNNQIVPLAPHQDGTKQGWRCSHSTWSLDDLWAAFLCV